MTRFKKVTEHFDLTENLTSCDYYHINDISKLRTNENDLSVIHLNFSQFFQSEVQHHFHI